MNVRRASEARRTFVALYFVLLYNIGRPSI